MQARRIVNIHKKPLRLILTVTALTLLLSILLACGTEPTPVPEAASAPTLTQAVSTPTWDPSRRTPEPESTPEPTATPEQAPETTCDLTEGSYPKIEEILANAVSKYETCELTETAAAETLDDHFGHHVLVQANLNSDDEKEFENWLDGDGGATTYTTLSLNDELRTYLYLPLSKLGTLSERDDVEDVTLADNAFGPDGDLYLYKPLSQEAKDNPTAELPGWLRGYAHPRSYPGLMNVLLQIARDHDLGYSTEKLEAKYPCYIEDGLVGVNMRVPEDDVDALLAWVTENDGLAKDTSFVSTFGTSRKVGTAVPPSLLEELGERPDTEDVDNGFCPSGSLSPGSTDSETRSWTPGHQFSG